MAGPSDATRDEAERRAFAVPPASGHFRDIDLSRLDPADPDERGLLIQAEHPELADAIRRGDETAFANGEEINPRLHLTIHEVITNQLWDNDPPETWQTAQRLLDAGYERHEIFHMLGSAFAHQLWRVLSKGEAVDHEQYLRDLAALPGGWEQHRIERRQERAAKRKTAKAKKAERQSRKRNRRR